MKNLCTFSPCRGYRYALIHRFEQDLFAGPAGLLPVFIGLNPSTADEGKLDPTLRRIAGFVSSLGLGQGFVMLNLYAFRATDPDVCFAQRDPVGPRNDDMLLRFCREQPRTVVACWGADTRAEERAAQVVANLKAAGIPLHALHVTAGGAPGHPLYLPGTAKLTPYP